MEALTTTAPSISARSLARGLEEKRQITHLKLQKLVTLVESLAEYALGQPAFPEDVQAWKYGPAVKALFSRYSDSGDAPITAIDSAASNPVPADLLRIIDEVWGVAGQLCPADLWTLTHTVGPWKTYYKPDAKSIVIRVPTSAGRRGLHFASVRCRFIHSRALSPPTMEIPMRTKAGPRKQLSSCSPAAG